MHAAPVCLLFSFLAACLPAQQGQDDAEKRKDARQDESKKAQTVPWEHGKVTVGKDLATIDLPEGHGYLRDQLAQKMVESWGNPPDPEIIGLIAPLKSDESWAIIVSYEDEGHVNDADAKDLDYNDLLRSMQEATRESNKTRTKAGYPTVELLGWAQPPHYESATKKLYWAKKLRFGDASDIVLNYDVRILGRRGVLVFQAVDDVENLAAVAAGCKEMLSRTEFTPGNRYSDFDPSLDEVAAYGIGGLIAGKLLLKGGFFKLLGALIKPILVGLAVVGGVLLKIFGSKKKTQEAPAAE